MMPTWEYLLLSYGITFGIQNKLPFLRGKSDFTDRLIKCTYCLGFHAGWMTWGLYWLMSEPSLGVAAGEVAKNSLLGGVSWGLASAAFSYGIDTAIRWLEYRPR